MIVLLLALRHYGYYHVPEAMQSGAFSIMASLVIIVCVCLSDIHRSLKAWAIGEESMVAGCTAVWLAWPWEPGDELCSDQLGIKLGVIGVAWLALAMVPVKNRQTESVK